MNFDRYLPIFQDRLRGMLRHGRLTNFLLPENYQDNQLFTRDVYEFSSLLYATNLLSQVVASNITTDFSHSETKEVTFPEIFGILSSSRTHICPALLPMAFIYARDHRYNFFSSPWDFQLEKDAWFACRDKLDEVIIWTCDRMEMLLEILCQKKMDAANVDLIKKLVQEEHHRIGAEILQNPKERSRIV